MPLAAAACKSQTVREQSARHDVIDEAINQLARMLPSTLTLSLLVHQQSHPSYSFCSAQVMDPGLIGGLLLPVLGALPDSAIIVVSGMGGTVAEAQEQVLRAPRRAHAHAPTRTPARTRTRARASAHRAGAPAPRESA
jgi:hypothetical protein